LDNNLDENSMNKIKNMVDNGDLSGAISQISPEMIQNFSKLLSNNNNNSHNTNNPNKNSNTYSKNTKTNSNFDFSSIDMNTIMKMKTVMEKMNSSSDPRSNLLESLKPYMREGKKEKIDQYANLLKMANVAEIMKNDQKGDFK